MGTRRSLLTPTATVASITLAGCSALLEAETSRHYVGTYNGDDEPHVFVDTVTNDADEVIFDREYQLGDRSADEDNVIDDTPAAVTVTIDDTEPMQFPWVPHEGISTLPEDGCFQATAASLYYKMGTNAGITPIYDCETVQEQ